MLFEIGIDLIEIERIRKSMQNKSFLSRVLGAEEYEQLKQRGMLAQSVAGNFCAKEAFSKAVGTGFRGIKLKEVQIMRNNLNKPYIKLLGKALELYGNKKNKFSVSISHTRFLAIAIVSFATEEERNSENEIYK